MDGWSFLSCLVNSNHDLTELVIRYIEVRVVRCREGNDEDLPLSN